MSPDHRDVGSFSHELLETEATDMTMDHHVKFRQGRRAMDHPLHLMRRMIMMYPDVHVNR